MSADNNNFCFFWRTFSPFSQWHPALFTVKDIVFTSAEQFMMYCKAKLFNDEVVAQKILKLNETTPILFKFIDGHFQKEGYSKNDILKDENLLAEWNKAQRKIKDLGKEVANFKEEEWCKHRENYVYRGNFEKFTQNEDLKKELLNTGNAIMVEASPYDKIWGIGMKKDHPNATDPNKWFGLNLLGKILTQLKNNLRIEMQ